MAVRAVIFDVDGTLIDSVDLHARAWQETFRHFGREIPFAEIRGQIGKGGDQLMPVFLPEDEVERCGKEIEEHRKGLYKAKYLVQARPFPEVRSLLSASAGRASASS
jgi:beta-phosphoglucomutase-like phosphatase (HAD superfamily)